MLRRAGALLCALLTACASTTHLVPHESRRDAAPQVLEYEAVEVQPTASPGQPIPISPADFQRALHQLTRGLQLQGSPQQAAR